MRKRPALIRAAIAVFVLATGFGAYSAPVVVPAQPEGATWTRLTPMSAPPGRSQAAMTASPAGGLVLFGGSVSTPTGLVALGDTWLWWGEGWEQQHPPFGPPPRAQAAIATDVARGTAVLFGGNTFARRLGDTWTWDGTDWNLHQPAVAPSARAQAAMAYDAARGVVLLYGGTTGSGALGDTWIWNGSTWTLLHPAAGPPPLVGASMAADPASGLLVLHGGASCPPGAQNCQPMTDTWTWDGSTWARTADGPPSACTLAENGIPAGVVAYCTAFVDRAVRSETWLWVAGAWTVTTATTPSARTSPALAFTPAQGVSILFGGEDATSTAMAALNDTWVFGAGP